MPDLHHENIIKIWSKRCKLVIKKYWHDGRSECISPLIDFKDTIEQLSHKRS